jgi:hypothetical protein
MSDESSGERDIGVMKATENEILEEKYLNRIPFQTITSSEVWNIYVILLCQTNQQCFQMCKPMIGQLGILQFSQVKDTAKNFFSSFYMHLKFKKCFPAG